MGDAKKKNLRLAADLEARVRIRVRVKTLVIPKKSPPSGGSMVRIKVSVRLRGFVNMVDARRPIEKLRLGLGFGSVLELELKLRLGLRLGSGLRPGLVLGLRFGSGLGLPTL